MLLRMSVLPRPEYEVMQWMIEKYGFGDNTLQAPSELFAVLLRLGYEVTRYEDGAGEQWLLRVIEEIRKGMPRHRTYDLK